MERTALINKVKTRIDEVCASGDTIVEVGVENTKPYDSIIGELLDESAIEVLLKAPFYRLNVTSATITCNVLGTKMITANSIQGNGAKTVPVSVKNAGRAKLPTDFLRLVSFKMTEWKQPIDNLYMPSDEMAKRQANIHTRAGVVKPVGVLKKLADGYAIDYYSVSSEQDTHSLDEFLYIKKDTAENIADTQLVDAMCWICAGKTLGVLGENALANQCYENAKGLML